MTMLSELVTKPSLRFRHAVNACLVIVVLQATCGIISAQARQNKFRKLAPGIVTKIKPEIDIKETFSGPRELVEVSRGHTGLDWNPNYWPKSETLLSKANSVVFHKPVWGLEFGFKPMRLIESNGNKIWYLVYYVKNNGFHKNPKPVTDDRGHVIFKNEDVNHTVRFFPAFVLESHEIGRAYLDDINHGAFGRIARREDPNRKFYSSVEISSIPIKVSTPEEDNSVWGIVMWNKVDPRTDFFSIYVSGLTNAYEWDDPAGAFKPGDPPGTGRRYRFKTLQLNFWSPGDSLDLKETEFRFGLPTEAQLPPNTTEDEILKIYRIQERVDHLWIYR